MIPAQPIVYKTYKAQINSWDDYVNHVGYIVENDIIVGVVGWGHVGNEPFNVSLNLARDDHSKPLSIYFPLKQGLTQFKFEQVNIPNFSGIHFNLPESGLKPKNDAYDFLGSNIKALQAWWQMFYGDKAQKK